MKAVFNYFISWLVLLSFSTNSFAKDVNPESLQAAYIQKFIHYIEWPAFDGDKFTIAVYQNPAMAEAIGQAFGNSVVLGKQVQVVNIEKVDKKTNYNIIHVQKIDQGLSKEILQLKLHGILIITQSDSGLDNNAQINFFFDNEGKLRFDINQTSSLVHGLKINSRLLNLARSLR